MLFWGKGVGSGVGKGPGQGAGSWESESEKGGPRRDTLSPLEHCRVRTAVPELLLWDQPAQILPLLPEGSQMPPCYFGSLWWTVMLT